MGRGIHMVRARPRAKIGAKINIIRLQREFSAVIQPCWTLCNPMDCSMPVFPVHHQLPELAQTHVHQVGDE